MKVERLHSESDEKQVLNMNTNDTLGQKKLIISFSGTTSLHFHMAH